MAMRSQPLKSLRVQPFANGDALCLQVRDNTDTLENRTRRLFVFLLIFDFVLLRLLLLFHFLFNSLILKSRV